jgi:hypothetical protein
MKLSKVFHITSVLAGLVGFIMLILAWFTGENGTILTHTEMHWFNDAQAMILVAIWIQLATMHHMKLKEKGEKI